MPNHIDIIDDRLMDPFKITKWYNEIIIKL